MNHKLKQYINRTNPNIFSPFKIYAIELEIFDKAFIKCVLLFRFLNIEMFFHYPQEGYYAGIHYSTVVIISDIIIC